MKAPKCPKCGKEHWSRQECGRPTDKAKAREPEDGAGGDADLPQPPKASRGGKRVVEPAVTVKSGSALAATMTIKGESLLSGGFVELDPSVTAALTSAEKQKAYRERHKDRVQEADRLRKRKQREPDNDSD